MRLPGRRHWFLGYQYVPAPCIDNLTGARVTERIGLPPDRLRCCPSGHRLGASWLRTIETNTD